MAEPRTVRGPDGVLYQVPAEATEAQISAYLKAIPASTPAKESTLGQSTTTALALGGSAAAVPATKRLIEEVATNPQIVKGGRAVGETLGGLAGFVKGGPVGAAIGMASGEKAGGVLANAAQRVAVPIASAIDKATPYVQSLSTISGLQGGLDLAQMADPKRQDIGFLGVGNSNSSAAQFAARLELKLKQLMDAGMSKAQAYEALNAIVKASR